MQEVLKVQTPAHSDEIQRDAPAILLFEAFSFHLWLIKCQTIVWLGLVCLICLLLNIYKDFFVVQMLMCLLSLKLQM